MSASNTWWCFRECVGLKVVAVLRVERGKMLIFDDDTGLVFNDQNGTYWREDAEHVAKLVRAERAKLQQAHDDLREALKADGITEEAQP